MYGNTCSNQRVKSVANRMDPLQFTYGAKSDDATLIVFNLIASHLHTSAKPAG